MSGGQQYIVRVLRKVESWLGEDNYPVESAKVGKIMQRVAQADNVDQELSALYKVQGFGDLALRLMWLRESAEEGKIGIDNGTIEYHAENLMKLVLGSAKVGGSVQSPAEPVEIDALYNVLHKFGKSVEELKRASRDGTSFKKIDENRLFGILSELAAVKESGLAAGKESMVRFADACSEFLHYVLDMNLLDDVRIINVLDNANLTVQTVSAAAWTEDGDSLESTIDLLKRPQDLLS